MKKRNDAADARSRLDADLAAPGPADARPSYSLSAAAAGPLKRRLKGRWVVAEHQVDGEDYLVRFASRLLKGGELKDALYRAEYEFRDQLCLKKVEIDGLLATAEGHASYSYRLRVACSWDLDGKDRMRIAPELGYQFSELDGQAAGVKELDSQGEAVSVAFSFDGAALILEEGTDRKRLERRP